MRSFAAGRSMRRYWFLSDTWDKYRAIACAFKVTVDERNYKA